MITNNNTQNDLIKINGYKNLPPMYTISLTESHYTTNDDKIVKISNMDKLTYCNITVISKYRRPLGNTL